MTEKLANSQTVCMTLIPLPIIRLNRLTILLGVIIGFVLHAPFVTTVLFVSVALAAIFGRRASIIYRIGTLALRPSEHRSAGEDPRLMRFNNALAAIILGAAQLAFIFHAPLIGWIFSGLAALAAAIALAGFCFGCFLFYQFKLNRARLFGSTTH
jgi:hypothetical protein